MPEIKHHFTGGKMNKDLDERLIQNGEYRDAMNIQVSTSEESEVGTIQNILGNSLVPGQNFIQEGAFCVGSVSDEKNDKLYYFVTENNNIINNGDFTIGTPKNTNTSTESTAEGFQYIQYDFINNAGWEWQGSTQKIKGTNVEQSKKINKNDLIDGTILEDEFYKVKFTISGYDKGSLYVGLYNEDGKGFRITAKELREYILGEIGVPSFVNQSTSIDLNGEYTFVKRIGSHNTANSSFFSRFFIQSQVNDDPDNDTFTGFIDNISISRISNYIIEYDSKQNSVKPVVVDMRGDVLNFSPEILITGINVIDGMLFFTDNHTEPKKINIQRCIKGTDPSGKIHTDFVNEKTNINVPIEEKHITVLKEKPAHPPSIELLSERDYNLNYSGVIKITKDPGSGANESSFNIGSTSPYDHYYDFSELSVGQPFHLRIETDLNGSNGFSLDWAVGDELYFKPFEGVNYDQTPGIPFNNYAVKAKILSSSVNDFTDTPSELIINNNFDLPNSTGTNALAWSYNGFGGSGINWTGSSYEINTPGNYRKIFASVPGGWVEGATYEMSVTVSNYTSGALSYMAVVPASTFGLTGAKRIFRGGGNATFGSATTQANNNTGNGVFTYTFLCEDGQQAGTTANWGTYVDNFLIEFYHPSQSHNLTIDNVSVKRLDSLGDATVELEIMDITPEAVSVPSNLNSIKYGVDKYFDETPIFEFKFPRIAYRWKYQDGEYSAISPFSQVAFLPGTFDYHPKKGFNTGMVNRINAIEVKGFKKDIPDGVSEIEIVYKDDSAPNLYIVDTIKPEHLAVQAISRSNSINSWNNDIYIIDSEQVNRAIESNQLLRPYDNVPKKALAQEVSGSRIIYGNYTQGYDLKTLDSRSDYYPEFDFTKISSSVDYTQPSIKSLREYQVGAVFVDKYGRETPVISNKTGTTKLIKSDGKMKNKFQVGFNDSFPPEELEYFKFFIKETSGEYYNLAMDRFYEAEDDQMWLSFPSSDINKIAIDDFIILKKALDQDTLVEDETRYKVIDIQQEAPEFIKTQRFVSEEISHQAGNSERDLFGSVLDEAPLEGEDTFKTKYEPFAGGSGGKLHTTPPGQLYIEFEDSVSGVVSDRYQVVMLSEDSYINPGTATSYTFKLKKPLGDDVNFMLDSVNNPTKIQDGMVLKCYQYVPKNLSQFDGKFFAKIHVDLSANQNLLNQISGGLNVVKYQRLFSKKIYNIKGNFTETHGMKWTGMVHGVYADRGTSTQESYTPTLRYSNYPGSTPPVNPDASTFDDEGRVFAQGFGPYACYFRNYGQRASSAHRHDYTYNASNHLASNAHTIGQYAFGSSYSSTMTDWVDELCYITANKFFPASNQSGHLNPQGTYMMCTNNDYSNSSGDGRTTGTKSADDQFKQSSSNVNENSIWYIHQGPREGNDWNVDGTSSTAARLSFSGFSPGPSSGGGAGIQSNYSTNAARWLINVGGIFHQKGLKGSSGTNVVADSTIDDFWKIGQDGGNPNYQDSMTKNLHEKLSSTGTKMRWREDHNANIYTVKSLDGLHGQINWDIGDDTYTYANQKNTNNQSFNQDHGGKIAAQLSPNFSLQYRVLTADEDGGGTVPWNPVGALGPIVGGLKLTVASHSTEASIINSNQVPVIHVETLQATHTDGSTHPITVGMILTSHSGGGASDTYGGANPSKSMYELLIYDIKQATGGYFKLFLCGYREPLLNSTGAAAMSTFGSTTYLAHDIYSNLPTTGTNLVFEQPTMNGYSENSCNRINAQNNMNMTGTGRFGSSFYDGANSTGSGGTGVPRIMPVFYNLEFIREINVEVDMPTNPAIWETEPKESTELDIYYEATGYNPKILNEENKYIAFPIGSTIETYGGTDPSVIVNSTAQVIEVGEDDDYGWFIRFDSNILYGTIGNATFLQPGDRFKITRPDGVGVVVVARDPIGFTFNNNTPARDYIYIQANLYSIPTYILPWHNCYSFGNGVESNRIRDNFNLPFISNGVKASTTVPFPSEGEEHRKHGLIYSGLYNSISGVNNLNQFIAAEKITKDINPIYGSIQKLHSRDTDLVTLCEDKVLKILANKDAVFNADGNPQLTANQNVLGQTVPFIGEYGISKNPESFASEAYRAYFTDRVRGKVMRLSKDGLTAISDHGMKDWFRDNLSLGSINLLGENNLNSQDNWNIPSDGNSAVINGEAILGYYNNQPTDDRFGKIAKLRMENVMEPGKTYRLRYEVVSTYDGSSNSGAGYGYLNSSSDLEKIAIVNTFSGSGWISACYSSDSIINGAIIDKTFVSNRTDLEFLQYQINSSGNAPVSGYTATSTQTTLQLWAADQGDTDWSGNYFYGSTVKIKNIILEEVKPDLKLIGSYDDKKDEYNITVHNEKPATVSFKEDVRGWVSFKSFTPENALSCANDYFTLKDGKLWQHHNPGVNRNTFYNEFTNSSFNAILNDMPSMIKSYHTLEYEGSQSRIEGVKTCVITGVEHLNNFTGVSTTGRYAFFELSDLSAVFNEDVYQNSGNYLIKQYRGDTLIYEGYIRAWINVGNSLTSPSGGPTKGHLRRNATADTSDLSNSQIGNFEVGDIITTQQQEETVNVFNSTPSDGWFVSEVSTEKEKGSLLEFVEKEDKWFNYIKGLDLSIDETTDYGSFDIQGLGIVNSIDNNVITISGSLNYSFQEGDIVYYERPTRVFEDDIVKLDEATGTNLGNADYENAGWHLSTTEPNKTSWAATLHSVTGVNYLFTVTTEKLVVGQLYFATLKVENYTGSNGIGVSTAGGFGSTLRFNQNDVDSSGYGYKELYFTATTDVYPRLFADTSNQGTLTFTLQKVVPGGFLGFTQISASELQEAGVAQRIITDNSFDIAQTTSNLAVGDYCFFVKNQLINMNGLSGYYADVQFENNSKEKAELFVVSSEITESSK